MARVAAALIVAVLGVIAAVALAGEAGVQVRDGLVAATFEATPVPDALEAIRRATGVAVVLPPSVSDKALTLTVQPAPFELFLRRVLEALGLGGYALVYAPGGTAERLIVVEKAQGGEARAAPEKTPSPAARAGSTTPARRVSVPFLMRRAEAESMKLGAPGQVIVVEAPFVKTKTSECDGTSADYPVQTILVTDSQNTYVTSVIVCAPDGLSPGETLTLAPTPAEPPNESDPTYSRFTATAP